MTEKTISRPVLCCLAVFAICSAARAAEYFLIKTDETILAENFLHKLFGIAVLALVIGFARLSWKSIGFRKEHAAGNMLKGFALGAVCFSAAYLLECLLLYCMNGSVKLAVYASGFSLSGEAVRQKGFVFILLCVAFNIINVWMEEGVFRGLFMRILEPSRGFRYAVIFSALTFGVWHWVMPMRDFLQGQTSAAGLLVMGFGYIILAGIMSIKWSILYKLTGSLLAGLGDHLFNNVVVTNLLHVISNGEADSMQIVRILIGQLLSFAIVMIYYRKSIKNSRCK